MTKISRPLSIRIFSLLVLAAPIAMSACNSDSSASGGTPGPIDGTWNITNVTCNGVAGNSSIVDEYSNGANEKFIIANTSGSFVVSPSSGCTISIPATYAYSGTTLTMTLAGAITCSPASCNSSCGHTTSVPPYEYTYSLSGGSLTWTSQGTTDDTCTTASPAQANPFEYTMSQ